MTLDTDSACTQNIFESLLKVFYLPLRPNEEDSQRITLIMTFTLAVLMFEYRLCKVIIWWSSFQHQSNQYQLERDLPQIQKGWDLQIMISAWCNHHDLFLLLQQIILWVCFSLNSINLQRRWLQMSFQHTYFKRTKYAG